MSGDFTLEAILGNSFSESNLFSFLEEAILYTLAISPSLGGSRQYKRTTKTMGTPLCSSSNDEGPSRVWKKLIFLISFDFYI